MTDIITTLHPENDAETNLYPNIKGENIPDGAINASKLDSNVISMIGSLNPSGVDTEANILLKTSNEGIWVGSDTGHWYYWNGTQYVDGGVYQAVEISDGSVTKTKINSDVFTPDGIKMNGVTFVANQNRVSMVIYFERTGTMEINVKGTLVDGLAQTIIKIGHSTSNTAVNPTLQYSDIITDGDFNKTYNVNYSDPYVCVLFEIAVSSYTYYEKVLDIISPLITINNAIMTSYSNITFKNYTPNNYLYLVTGLPNITDSKYVENYVNNFYNLNTLPYLEKHNIINVSTSQELINAINSIATNADNNIATKINRYDIYLASGTYELYNVIDKSDISEHTLYKRGLEIPDYVNLYGVGDVTISLTLPTTESDANVRALSTINVYGENHFKNIKFTITNGRYCVHDDDGGKYKDRIISFTNCTFIHNGNTIGTWPQTYCIGAGYTGGRIGIYKNCTFKSPKISFYIHTSSNYWMTDKCYLTLENCVLNTTNTSLACLDIEDPYQAVNQCDITINNSYLNTKTTIRGTNPFTLYGGGNNNFNIDNNTTTPSKIYIVGNSNSDFTS